MLNKNSIDRISAEDALKHPWFNQKQEEMNNKKIEIGKNMDENKD